MTSSVSLRVSSAVSDDNGAARGAFQLQLDVGFSTFNSEVSGGTHAEVGIPTCKGRRVSLNPDFSILARFQFPLQGAFPPKLPTSQHNRNAPISSIRVRLVAEVS